MFRKYAVMPIITASPDKPDWVDLESYGIEREEGFFYFSVRAISEGENDNADCFPPDELRRAYKTFEGKPLFLNHQSEDVSKAVGKVVKAYLIEEIPLWIKTIVALDEKNHPDLADKIRRGIITDVSMGCYTQETICSVCGNVAKTEFDFCEHIKSYKGSIDSETQKRVFEICRDIEFYELSLVTSGADPDAMVLELLASNRDSSIEMIERLPICSESSGDGVFLLKKFDYDIPSYIIVKKEKGRKQFLPISFYYSYRVPGRWTDSEEDAIRQLESRGVLSETKVANYFTTLTLNPRIAKILEPVFQTYSQTEEPLSNDKNLIRKALRNGAVPLSGLPPSEALSVWNKLESEVGQVFTVGDFVRFNGRVHRIIHLKDGIAELLDSDNNLGKAVEYMLSRTFPPAKKAIFEKYLEISGKSEDEAYDAFISGKELEFDKADVLKAYWEIIGEEVPEDKIEGLAVLLSRKPWLDFDKIAPNLKQKSGKEKNSEVNEIPKAGYLNIIFYIRLDAEAVNHLLSKEGIDYQAVPNADESKIEHVKEEDIDLLQRVLDENKAEYSIYTLEPLFPLSQKEERKEKKMRSEFRKKAVNEEYLQNITKDLQNVLPYLENAFNDVEELKQGKLFAEFADILKNLIWKAQYIINNLREVNAEDISEFAEDLSNECQLLYDIEHKVKDLGNNLANLQIARNFESGIAKLITLDYILTNTEKRVERRKVLKAKQGKMNRKIEGKMIKKVKAEEPTITDEEYAGWDNWETWNIYTIYTGYDELANEFYSITDPDAMKDFVLNNISRAKSLLGNSDLSDEEIFGDLAAVNWQELASSNIESEKKDKVIIANKQLKTEDNPDSKQKEILSGYLEKLTRLGYFQEAELNKFYPLASIPAEKFSVLLEVLNIFIEKPRIGARITIGKPQINSNDNEFSALFKEKD